jgi:hypothetical protein
MIYITTHKQDGNPTGISVSYYPLPLNDEYVVATLEMSEYPPLEELSLPDILSQLKIQDGVLVSDTLNITSQQINQSYVEPSKPQELPSKIQTQLENI